MILMTFHDFSLISMIFRKELEEKRKEEKRLQEEREAQQWVKTEASGGNTEASGANPEEGVRRNTCTIS